LTSLQKESFDYCLQEIDPLNGLVKDKTADNWLASIAAVGMARTIYPIGVDCGFMTRRHAVQLTLAALRFFADTERGQISIRRKPKFSQ
jgi:hypothetical protein